MPKVFVAVPNQGYVIAQLAEVLTRWAGKWGDALRVYAPPYLFPIDLARNVCVREFLKGDWEYLLFVDSDVEPPSNALEVLLAHDRDIVSAMVPTAKKDVEGYLWPIPSAYKRHGKELLPYFGEGLAQVDAVGAGCLLVKRVVFEKLPAPWFKLEYNGNLTEITRGEDFYFSDQARMHGFSIWVDYNVRCSHYTRHNLAASMGTLLKTGAYQAIMS